MLTPVLRLVVVLASDVLTPALRLVIVELTPVLKLVSEVANRRAHARAQARGRVS